MATRREKAVTYAPGMRIICRDAQWRITGVEALRGMPSEQAVRCSGVDEFVRGQERIFLTHLDTIEVADPGRTVLVPDESSGFRRSLLFVESYLRQAPATGQTVPWEGLGVYEPLPFQKKAVRRTLSQLYPRMLIADAVGLGKTIQVGMILAELMRRKRADRVLVLAKKSMLAQFQAELWNRFNIPLIRLDSTGIARLRQRIPANKNPFETYRRIIISMDTLKNHGRYERFLLDTHWDVVIIDEAHNVAGASVPDRHLSNRLARVLARRTDALLLTTATPHNGQPDTFGRLISLVDPTAIADPDLREYEAADVRHAFLMRFKEDVRAEARDNLRDRKVIEMERTSVPAMPAEEKVYAALSALRRHGSAGKSDGGKSPGGKDDLRLARYGIYKMFLSSPEACTVTIHKRLASRAAKEASGPLDEDLKALLAMSSKLALEKSSRFQLLLAQLKDIGWTGQADSPRVLVFTEYRETQKALAEALAAQFKLPYIEKSEAQAGQSLAVIHGGTGDTHLMAAVEAFATGDAEVRMLLATDVASEGVNLHHQCHQIIHYDLPWSIITLVQRNGRIDRIGQKHTPEIRYLMVNTHDEFLAGDVSIFARLIAKVEEINKLRKDEGSVLGLYDEQKEEEYIAENAVVPGDPEALEKSADPTTNLLETLLEANRKLEEELASEGDFAPDIVTQPDPSSFRLFSDDDFFHEGYRFLQEQNPGYPPASKKGDMLVLSPPDDLKRRLGASDARGDVIYGSTEIPLEAWSADGTFRFTTLAKRVETAIEAARNSKEGHWSRELYCNEHHPILMWLQECLALEFSRGEAPIIQSAHVDPDELLFCFVAQATSRSGYPLFTIPHAISIRIGGSIGKPEALDQALARAKVNTLANPGQLEFKGAQTLVPAMVQQSREHAQVVAEKQHGELIELVRTEERRLTAWHKKRRVYLEAKLERAVNRQQKERFQMRLDELEDFFKQHRQRIRERFDLAAPTTELVLVVAGSNAALAQKGKAGGRGAEKARGRGGKGRGGKSDQLELGS